MSSIKGDLQRLEKLSMLRRLPMHSTRPYMSTRGGIIFSLERAAPG
jgi:hypothetical protein